MLPTPAAGTKESRSSRGAYKKLATGAMVGLDTTISILPDSTAPPANPPPKLKLLPTPTAHDDRGRDPKRASGPSLTEVVRRILPVSAPQ